MKIKKGDNILVIAGKDRGKTGTIQKAIPKEQKVLIEGVNLAKHHLKPSRKNPHGGILDMPEKIDASNVMVLCPHCNRPTRVAYKLNSEIKERICRQCKGNLDVKEKNVKA